MRIERADPDAGKGRCVGHWKSDLNVSVGFANEGIHEPDPQRQVTEIYIVARGSSMMRIEQETIQLRAGDVAVIEPGGAHTFLSSSSDYLHFLAHVPGLTAAEARRDKISLPRSRLDLLSRAQISQIPCE